MEFVLCFALAVSVFILLITTVVGIVSAPTPILIAILVAGMMLTQKSINKFKVPDVKLEDRDKNKIEKVEIAINLQNQLQMQQNQEVEMPKSGTAMTYRGFNYHRSSNLDKNVTNKNKVNFQYRGVKVNNSQTIS